MSAEGRAVVVGAGPNGLAAAIVMAQAGMRVEVFEAEEQPGGGARTMELTLPEFRHDFGSAVHAMAAGSPFFSTLPLAKYGLEWVHPSAPVAHPLDDGTAVMLERDLDETVRELEEDGEAWRTLVEGLARHWKSIAADLLRPMIHVPQHPFMLAGFGVKGLMPASMLAKNAYRNVRTRALFAGLAAHSFLAMDEPLSAAFGIILAATAHAVGWPIARGGSQAITQALIAHLESLGGSVKTAHRVVHLSDLDEFDVALCDVTPHALIEMAGERLTPAFRNLLGRYRRGPGVFKVDYALTEPIPWKAKECARAGTLHLGGTLEEIAESEESMRKEQHAERPFVLLSQPTLFDRTRAPEGKHVAWSYCHVPNGSTEDMLPRLEAQIERFAPGFKDCVLARRVLRACDLEAMDQNLEGGDINGGEATLGQFVFRPTWRHYATPDRRVYLCSASTPPGGGVHGMCGYNAAMLALRRSRWAA